MSIRQLRCFHDINWSPTSRDLQSFAKSMLIGFGIIGALIAWRQGGVGSISVILWIVGLVLAAATFIPGIGKAAFLLVYLPSALIGFVISHVVIFLLFLLLFVPIGAFLRLVGKDLLRLKRPRSSTLWWTHSPPRDSRYYYSQ